MTETLIFTFAPAWGLPSTGPFALKLLARLNHVGIPYRRVIENRPGRGPLGKSPWMEQGRLRLGDSDAIIAHLSREHGLPDPLAPTSAADARIDAIKTAFEERFHQVLEWELFIHPEGAAEIGRMVRTLAPPVVGGLIAAHMRRHFRQQLHARGIGRLQPEAIAVLGCNQLDALALCLHETGWLGGPAPVLADFAVWGQVAPMLHWPMQGPVARHARGLPELLEWHDRIMDDLSAGCSAA